MRQIRHKVRAILLGPQLLAFLPAITLSGYWIGGEAALIALTLIMPVAFAVGGLFSRELTEPDRLADPVTELPMRSEIVAAAEEILTDGHTGSVSTAALAIGIDEFKELNDKYGEEGVERLMRSFSDRISSVFRGGDLLCRLDGPRIGVVLRHGSRSDLESLIQASTRVQKAVQDPMSLDGTRVFLSASVGFCTARRAPDGSGEALVASAEQALDDAMAHGTGSIRAFSLDMQRRARSRGTMPDELPRAFENGEIRPWYQPQICAATSRVTGLEALARWEHPEWGLVPPAEFLPATEQLGLLGRLGEVMLQQSLNDLRAWNAEGINIPSVSVNFAADELRDPGIVERVRFELDRFDIAPERLAIEVLETVIAQTANDTIIRNLRALSDMGCGIDLDDFGTGHASIANIKRFAVNRIKIDRSFITQIDTDIEQQNIVSAILTLADRLELSTLAEGVETAAERAILRKLGCGHLQGYGICRPMPFVDVSPWVCSQEASLRAGNGAEVAVIGQRRSAPDLASRREQGKTA